MGWRCDGVVWCCVCWPLIDEHFSGCCSVRSWLSGVWRVVHWWGRRVWLHWFLCSLLSTFAVHWQRVNCEAQLVHESGSAVCNDSTVRVSSVFHFYCLFFNERAALSGWLHSLSLVTFNELFYINRSSNISTYLRCLALVPSAPTKHIVCCYPRQLVNSASNTV